MTARMAARTAAQRNERRPRERTRGFRDGLCRAAVLIGLVGWVSTLPCQAAAQVLSRSETEALVRADYFEGLPVEEASRIGPDGAARLIEMLQDPEEHHAHANILTALGASGAPGALEAIDRWAAVPREGEIDRDTFRAWQALPYSLGHLAEFDRRAVARLEAELSAAAPNFTFRHHRGARLHHLLRRGAASALGMTGLPEAGEVLDRAERRTTDVDFENHLREARVMHAGRAARRSAR